MYLLPIKNKTEISGGNTCGVIDGPTFLLSRGRSETYQKSNRPFASQKAGHKKQADRLKNLLNQQYNSQSKTASNTTLKILCILFFSIFIVKTNTFTHKSH